MNAKLDKIIQYYDEKLYKLLSNSFTINDVIDLFWESITEVYILSLEESHKLKISNNLIKEIDLKKLTYDGSAEKTEQRIFNHIKTIFLMEKLNNNTIIKLDKILIKGLFTLLARLFENEIKYVFNQILFIKTKESNEKYYYQIITGEMCEYCRDIAGKIYSSEEIELIGIPPYHPDCDCELNILTEEERNKLNY